MRNFKKLLVWQKAMKITELVYELCAQLPSSELYGLRSQMSRAAVSIPSNIAEGCSREGMKDQARFINISIGSTFELETQLLLVRKVFPQTMATVDGILSEIDEEGKMLTAFLNKILSDPGRLAASS